MSAIMRKIIADAKEIAHDSIAAGVGALGAGLVAKATGVAAAVVSGDWGTVEHIGVGLTVATGLAAWRAARKVLAAIFAGRQPDAF